MTGSPLGRVVEIAEEGRHLAKERGFLAISAQGEVVARLPLDDLAGVIATARGATLTSQLVAALAERNVPLVLCGAKFAPVAILWPVEGHHAQQRRMEAQLACGRPLARRLWAQVVAAKVRRQGRTLEALGERAGAFEQLARKVRSGDPANIEAQAARRYWPLLMGRDFRRDRQGGGANALLNYGYAVLRSATARAVAAAGLHPGLGIFHRHPNNPMPLVDDLMEPYRPVVDLEVRLMRGEGLTEPTPEAKRRLAMLLWSDQPTAAGVSPLSTCLVRSAQSLAESFVTRKACLDFPILAPDASPCPTPLP